ncbi:MAG TPA: alpha-glucosidase [Acidobacteriaceae bacterium]|jgi:alpha-glucosidase|nr:alpha-glucosidase [Acidobacteriaceae bacterium]
MLFAPISRGLLVSAIALLFLVPGSNANAYKGPSGNQANPASASYEDTSSANPWWKHAVIYEVYPRSLQDTNGDGIGDLNGITQRLGYLQNLGVTAIWLTPIYPSPQVDFGYDISNYEAIDPMYGTMADFDHLVAEAKKHNIRVIMDMVMNHTSDQHSWFLESRSSRNNPKRDWYVWRDGKGPGQPPNNWLSDFGHSSWTYDAKTKQWYYHKFAAQQPDLNWNNPAVQKAMFDAVRFWLNRGVAGFRLDAITTLFEDPQFRDEKILPGKNEFGDPNEDDAMTNNLPQVHDVLRSLRKVVDTYPGQRVLIGETYLPNIHQLYLMYGKNNDETQLPMDMQLGFLDKLDVNDFRKRINEAETQLGGNQPLFIFDNHDNPRSWNRYGDGVHDAAIARIIAAVLLTTRSAALMYYGQEIGMVTTPPKTRAEVQDPIGKTGWPKNKGRDGERTPMQWTPGKDAGFSTANKTWLPVAPDYKTVDVQVEAANPNSLYNWYKTLIAMRRDNPALRDGSNIMLNTSDPNVLSYLRKNPGAGSSVLVAMNFTAQPHTVSFDLKDQGIAGTSAQTLLQNGGVAKRVFLNRVTLPPFAVFIGQVQ